MITLFGFGPAFKLPDASPFVIKADVLLKMSRQPYKTDWSGDPRKAPKKKMPYIVDDGEKIADSTLIRWHLEKKYGIDFDQGLTAEQRAISWSLQVMAEDHLYWAMVDFRWNDDTNFNLGPRNLFRKLPPVLRTLVANKVRSDIVKSLYGHGIGRHSKAEITALADHDFQALATMLGEKPFMFGDTPTNLDALVFGIMAASLCTRFVGSFRETAEQYSTLKAHCARMAELYYPEIQNFGGFLT